VKGGSKFSKSFVCCACSPGEYGTRKIQKKWSLAKKNRDPSLLSTALVRNPLKSTPKKLIKAQLKKL
jgi:hypothetical protein